jgi:hypothetical protein
MLVGLRICTFLLVSATQLARSFQRLAATPSGFAHDSIATFTCDLDEYKNAPVFLQALKDRVLQLPGVISVATSSAGVMREHGLFASVALAGQRVGHSEFMGTNGNQVSPGYFSTMGVRLITGRDLTPSDTPKPNQVKSAVVNQVFVQRFFGTADPLGQRFGAAAEGTVA